MGFTAPKSQVKSDPAPAGPQIARLVQLIDLGTHDGEWQGKPTSKREVRLGFELPTELKVFREENGEQPYMVGRNFGFSLHEKANLRKFLEAWRGKKFSDEEAYNFDISTLLAQPAMISISHTEKGERTYANIDAAMKLPKGSVCPEQINESIMFHLDDLGNDKAMRTLAGLPDWQRKVIESSKEYIRFEAQANGREPVAAGKASEDNDDIPFN